MVYAAPWLPQKPLILLVDDDLRLQQLIGTFLRRQGCFVTVAANVSEAKALLPIFAFDMAIIDVMLGHESGLDLTQAIRSGACGDSQLPLLMLSALGEAEDRIKGLSLGADDYLGKPFEPQELILRLGSLWRRSTALHRRPPPENSLPQNTPSSGAVKIGSYHYESERSLLLPQSSSIPAISLTPQEKIVLDRLLEQHGQQVERDTLQAALNPNTPDKDSKDSPENRSLDIYITRLRRKIEADPKTPRHLLTIRGGGYKIVL